MQKYVLMYMSSVGLRIFTSESLYNIYIYIYIYIYVCVCVCVCLNRYYRFNEFMLIYFTYMSLCLCIYINGLNTRKFCF